MKVTNIKLIQYRNFTSLAFRPHPRLTILLGENAQGKTNLLESVSLCASGRSFRTAKDAQLIQWGCEGAYIGLELAQGRLLRSIQIKLRKNKGKQIKLDGASISRMGELMGCLYAVTFSPEDLRLVKDGPAERRRFLDTELSQIRPDYFYALSYYTKALAQRNALLKKLTPGASHYPVLDGWDEQLAQYGATLITARQAFLKQLSEVAWRVHNEITRGKENISIEYSPDIYCESTDVQNTIYRILQQEQISDVQRGVTTRGPHRDDLLIRLDERDARIFASQGQQRTCALALKISELEIMHSVSGESPVLLLDDVLSELDFNRQTLLLRSINDYQTILTCTQLPPGLEGDVYRVRNGEILCE